MAESIIYISNIYLHDNSTRNETLYEAATATLTAWSKSSNGYSYRFEIADNQYQAKKRVELNRLFIYFTNGYSPFAIGYYLPVNGIVQFGQYNDCGKYSNNQLMYYTQPSSMNDYITFETPSSLSINRPYVNAYVYDIVPVV